eukprot:GGOE01054218.1.p1 GENE.GGOE01054218.1~~GGOE01054218.1.p1  ORF type:complete len:631 (+),score=250.22 GGOE01054218.1:80-1972(+)
MAEVDELILYGLRSAGVALGDVQGLRDFDGDAFFQACAACVRLLQPTATLGVPSALPANTAARFKACNALSKAIQQQGYQEEIGFNAFMYVNVDEMRRVLSWLVGALPAVEEPAAEPKAANAFMTIHSRALVKVHDLYELSVTGRRKTLRRISKEEAAPHTLLSLRPVRTTTITAFPRDPDAAHRTPFVFLQPPDRRDLPMSLVEFNTAHAAMDKQLAAGWERHGIHKGQSLTEYRAAGTQRMQTKVQGALQQCLSRYDAEAVSRVLATWRAQAEGPAELKKASRFQQELDFAKAEAASDAAAKLDDASVGLSEEELAAQNQAEEERLKVTLQRLETKCSQLESKIRGAQSETEAVQAEDGTVAEKLKDAQEEGKELELQYETQQRTIEYADDLPGNTAKLNAAAAAIQAEMDEIKTAFQEKLDKYQMQYEALAGEQDRMRKALEEKLAEMNHNKKKARHLQAEIQWKEEQKAALAVEYDRLPKTLDRELLISRIMDIMKNIKKQQNEITKINLDNKDLQKEINNANQAVTRSFIATEEKVYKSATRDQVAKQVYRQLVALRENFDELIGAVEQIGHLRQQQHELDGRKGALMQRNDGLNMERLQEDLETLRSENAQLQAELKALKKKPP